MGPLARIRLFLEMIKFSHTIFALPFALMGAILAARGIPDGRTLFWIVVAMVGARSGAMGMNRFADRDLDALNPRTKERALPRGLIRPGQVLALVGASFALLLLAAYNLNPLCLALAPLAIVILAGYSYTKRFTTLSHLILGLCLAFAPMGAWIAVAGRLELAPLLLGTAVLCWVAGFDILYALTDIAFDRAHGLFSIPARLGERGGLTVSLLLHALTPLLLAVVGSLLGLGAWYYAGVLFVLLLLAMEHAIIRRYGVSRLELAFFNVNGVLSVGIFLFTLADLLR
ncbi:MAG: putative 4-hydroxybenzoate polyprenyltransferase [candidate division NC10 bacterium]|nr:putative 4-hydroxybenzoate polyprenyltransferase [candidate division NC10 bacterium]